MSMFDPTAFLDMPLDAGSTQYVPVPEGEYAAVCAKIEFRTAPKKDGSGEWVFFEHHWEVDDAGVKELLGQSRVTVRGSVIVDTTESGGLDMRKGRNIQFNRLREALGVNTPGTPISSIVGRSAKIRVAHEADRSTGEPRAVVSAVTRLN